MGLREYAAQQAQETEREQEAQQPLVNSPLAREQGEQREATQRAAEVYKTHQENIKKAVALEAAILKGLKQGEPIPALFLKAAEAISRMTGNREFYQQAEADLLTVYGFALQEPEAAAIEAGKIKERLHRLEQAERETQDERERSTIAAAIRAHRQRLEQLKN